MNHGDVQFPHTSDRPARIDCNWVRENAPAHALGALDDAESDLLETHLLLCNDCDREVSRLRGTFALLGTAVAQIDPPAAIKRNLLAAIGTRPDQQTMPAPLLGPFPAQFAIPPLSGRSRWQSGRLIAMPLLCAVLVLGLWSISSHRNLGSQRTEIDRLERQNEALTVHLSSLQAGQQYFGNAGIWYPLINVDSSAGGAGGIVMSGSQDTMTLLSVWNMPDEHDSYNVLCESKRGELLAAGEIQVNGSGSGSVTLDLPVPVSEYRAVHVVPYGATMEADILTKDILQLLFGEPTAVSGKS